MTQSENIQYRIRQNLREVLSGEAPAVRADGMAELVYMAHHFGHLSHEEYRHLRKTCYRVRRLRS